jgi:hypothetical protein
LHRCRSQTILPRRRRYLLKKTNRWKASLLPCYRPRLPMRPSNLLG